VTPDMLLEAAIEVARVVGKEAFRHYGSRLAIETKSDGSVVTIADRAAEKVGREWLESWFCKDGIVGEELGITRPEAKRRWIIDPIDGTSSFIKAVPLWGTLVAVAEGESVIAGVAFFPALNEIIGGASGAGSWWNGSRCFVSKLADLSAATILTTDDRFRGEPSRNRAWQELVSRSSLARTWGDCYGYLLVATGRAEAMVDDRSSPWDVAAFMPIVTEAGGSLTDWRGEPTAFGGDAIATNALLAAEVRSALGVPETGSSNCDA
jgi:histidinol-phosphatase